MTTQLADSLAGFPIDDGFNSPTVTRAVDITAVCEYEGDHERTVLLYFKRGDKMVVAIGHYRSDDSLRTYTGEFYLNIMAGSTELEKRCRTFLSHERFKILVVANAPAT